MALAPALLPRTQAQDLSPIASRVYPGVGGKLVYVPDEQGNTILDSSHAGYAGGGVAIPTLPVRENVWPVAGDNTENIQAAINKVSARPLDSTGFRGVVLLKAGYYRMATPIRIQASGIVLRGEGMGDTGTILIGTGTGRTADAAQRGGGGNQGTLVMVGGPTGVTTIDDNPANHLRRLRSGWGTTFQGGSGPQFQARRHGRGAPHRQSGLDRRRRHVRCRTRESLAAIQHRL
jgi:hypothetical protein